MPPPPGYCGGLGPLRLVLTQSRRRIITFLSRVHVCSLHVHLVVLVIHLQGVKKGKKEKKKGKICTKSSVARLHVASSRWSSMSCMGNAALSVGCNQLLEVTLATHYHFHPFYFVLFKFKVWVAKQLPHTHTHAWTHTRTHPHIYNTTYTYMYIIHDVCAPHTHTHLGSF